MSYEPLTFLCGKEEQTGESSVAMCSDWKFFCAAVNKLHMMNHVEQLKISWSNSRARLKMSVLFLCVLKGKQAVLPHTLESAFFIHCPSKRPEVCLFPTWLGSAAQWWQPQGLTVSVSCGQMWGQFHTHAFSPQTKHCHTKCINVRHSCLSQRQPEPRHATPVILAPLHLFQILAHLRTHKHRKLRKIRHYRHRFMSKFNLSKLLK